MFFQTFSYLSNNIWKYKKNSDIRRDNILLSIKYSV